MNPIARNGASDNYTPTPLLGLIELSARLDASQVSLLFGTVQPDLMGAVQLMSATK